MTDIQKVRALIGAVNSDIFSDAEMQVFLDLQSGSILLAAALALDSVAAQTDTTPHEVSIGKFQYSAGRAQIKPLREQAEAFRQLEYNTPAIATAEENLSDFSYYEMLRNRALRNAPE